MKPSALRHDYLVTVTVYVFIPVALAIWIDTRLSPVAHVGAVPFVIELPFTVITTSVPDAAVAVTVSELFSVSVVYSFISSSNVGSSVREPIVRAVSFGVPASVVTLG